MCENKNETVGPKVEVITSAPSANSFYRAGFFKKYIPRLYRVNELELLKAAKKSNFDLFEYDRCEWTFHAKGAWIHETQVHLD